MKKFKILISILSITAMGLGMLTFSAANAEAATKTCPSKTGNTLVKSVHPTKNGKTLNNVVFCAYTRKYNSNFKIVQVLGYSTSTVEFKGSRLILDKNGKTLDIHKTDKKTKSARFTLNGENEDVIQKSGQYIVVKNLRAITSSGTWTASQITLKF